MAYIGEIKLVPFASVPKRYAACDGKLLPIKSHVVLFSLLNGAFGGDLHENFALPDTVGRVLVGTGYEYALGATEEKSEAPAAQPPCIGSLALNYIIALEGTYPASTDYEREHLGEIRFFAGDFAPAGTALCDGRTVGNTKLPDLRGRAVIGSGRNIALGATGEVSISTKKAARPRDSRSVAISPLLVRENTDDRDRYLYPIIGEIRSFAFDKVPEGWIPCNGLELSINRYTALFSLLGNRFGGDGISRFALPKVDGGVFVGQDAATRPAGSITGSLNDTGGKPQPFVAINYCIAVGGDAAFPLRV